MKQKLPILGILCLGLLLRLYFFVGPGYTDDIDYIYIAYHALTLHGISLAFLNSADLNAQRLMTVLPLAISFKLFGFNENSAVIYNISCSIGCILLTYLIARKSLGEKIGLLAALFYAVFPLDLFYSTQVGGDIPVAFFALFGVYLLMENYCFMAGIAWGVSTVTKENGLFFFFIFLAYLIAEKLNWKSIKQIMSGFFLIVLAELFIFYLYTGNPFHYLKIYESTQSMMQGETSLFYLPKYLLHALVPNFKTEGGLLGLSPFFVFFFFLLEYRKKAWNQNRFILFFFLWILFTVGYLEFGVMTITFHPILKWIRYWTILICPITILMARGMLELVKKFSLILTMLFILHSLWISYGNIAWIRAQLAYDKKPYRVLKSLPQKKIYINQEFLGRLQLYSKGKWKIVPFTPHLHLKSMADSYALIFPALLDKKYERLPYFLYHIPKNWKFLGWMKPRGENLRPPQQIFKLYFIPPNKTAPSKSEKKEANHL